MPERLEQSASKVAPSLRIKHDIAQVWKYTVLVTNAAYDIAAICQLQRDRRDCENVFDELKKQWG